MNENIYTNGSDITPAFSTETAELSWLDDNVGRLIVLAICLGAIGASMKLTGKSLWSFRTATNHQEIHVFYVLRYFETYFIFFCTLLSFVFSGGVAYAYILHIVCCAAYAILVTLGILVLVYGESDAEDFHFHAMVVGCIYSLASTITAGVLGWFGPLAGSDAFGFYFLGEKALSNLLRQVLATCLWDEADA